MEALRFLKTAKWGERRGSCRPNALLKPWLWEWRGWPGPRRRRWNVVFLIA